MFRARHLLVAIQFVEPRDFALEYLTAVDFFRLPTGCSAQLAGAWTAVKVVLAGLPIRLGYAANNSHLAFDMRPVEHQARRRFDPPTACLCETGNCKEHEPAVIGVFE